MNKDEQEAQKFKSLEELKDFAVQKGLVVKSTPSQGVNVTSPNSPNFVEILSQVLGKKKHFAYNDEDSGTIYYLAKPEEA